MTAKDPIKELIEALPDDATYEEIMRELAVARMIDRGLADAREGHSISNEGMAKRTGLWQ